jgi:hypothetical protein
MVRRQNLGFPYLIESPVLELPVPFSLYLIKGQKKFYYFLKCHLPQR